VQVETSKRGQAGDPRFLEQVHKCIELRLKLFGLRKPDEKKVVNFVNVDWEGLHRTPPMQVGNDPIETVATDPIEAKIALGLPAPTANGDTNNGTNGHYTEG
jgi:hypothetical protein